MKYKNKYLNIILFQRIQKGKFQYDPQCNTLYPKDKNQTLTFVHIMTKYKGTNYLTISQISFFNDLISDLL